MSLITFTTAYTGGPTFYTGNPGNSDLVPDIFPIAIAGRAYALDMASGRYARTFEARLRESSDFSDIPGEAAINPQGLWRRGQSSWHFGMNQRYGDLPDSFPQRFYQSLGVDVWTDGEVRLLPDTTLSSSTTNTNLYLDVVGTELWYTDGVNVKYTDDPYESSPTWSTVGGTAPSSNIRGMVSIGNTAYVVVPGTADGTGIVELGSSHTWPANSAHYNQEFDAIGYAKGRLCFSALNTSEMWIGEPASNRNLNVGSGHYTHPDANFRWIGFASGQNAIYCAGRSGEKSFVYKVTIQADGTLDIPIAAAELPVGERIYSISAYLGYVLIGTNEGLRYATPDAEANLVLGPTIPSPNPILCAHGYDQYVWVGVTDYTTEYTGTGRVDLGQLVDALLPANAPDLMYAGQGDVTDISTYQSKRVFAVSGVGIVAEDDTQLMPSGYIDTGVWRWGIPDNKFLAFFDLDFEPLNGTIEAEFENDSGTRTSLGTANRQGTTSFTMTGVDDSFREARFIVTLNRDADTASEGPVLWRWQARAVPAPTRSELFQIPILLHSRLYWKHREYFFDVDTELEFLRDLIHNPRIVTFQEGPRTYKVIAESVEWVPVDSPNDSYVFDGTATVTLRSLVE